MIHISEQKFEVPPKPKPTLFGINAQMQALDDLLTEIGGDLSEPEVEAAITTWFQENEDLLDAKLEDYAKLILEKQARADAQRAEAKRLTERARIEENGVAKMKERLQWFFGERHIMRAKAGVYSISLVKNGGKQAIELDDENWGSDPVQLAFSRTVLQPDTDRIRECLEGGGELPFARLKERASSIRIK